MKERTIDESQIGKSVKILLQAAMALFLFTTVVGILNGLDVVEFDRNTLLTHVHAGALGWITLGFFAACLWLLSEGKTLSGWLTWSPRWLSYGVVLAITLYVAAFYSGDLTWRLIGGSVVLIAIFGFFGWIVAQSRGRRLSTPHLGLLAAMTTLAIGAVLGVILGIWFKGGLRSLPQEIFVTHPTSLIVGYLVLAGMAISEWGLDSSSARSPASRAGWAQVLLPFLGGLVLTIGALLNNQLVIGLYVPLQVTGVIIFLIRLRSRVSGAAWLDAGSGRLFALSAAFLVANVGLMTYLVVSFLSGAYGDPPDFMRIPIWLIFAMDHAMFIGVMSNGLFGLVYETARGRRHFWPWADHLLFWGMNVGMVGFVVGLMRQSTTLKQIFTPIMGASILLVMLAYTIRLQTTAAPAVPHEVRPPGR
jgi:predicted membrane protein